MACGGGNRSLGRRQREWAAVVELYEGQTSSVRCEFRVFKDRKTISSCDSLPQSRQANDGVRTGRDGICTPIRREAKDSKFSANREDIRLLCGGVARIGGESTEVIVESLLHEI